MILAIIVNEWKGFVRDKIFLFLVGLFTLSLILVTWFGFLQNSAQSVAQHHAHDHIRAQWDTMEPSNPHRAAHYGTYAFKPINVLNSLDEGVNSVTGNVLRLEGHTQNDVMFSETSQSLLVSKFGKLKPALLFQFLIPLFLIFLSFNSYASERTSGRLKLLFVQGSSIPTIVFSKALSIWMIGVMLLSVAALTQFLLAHHGLNHDATLRLLLFLLSYGVYYWIVIGLTVALSILFQSATASLSLMIAIWVTWTLFFPKIIGQAAEQIAPLQSRIEFQDSIKEDRAKGLDGHNPSDERRKKLEADTLNQYNVENLKDLPINFAGIVMQADEEYGNQVWDKHFGDVYDRLEQQKRIVQRSGFINPFGALQSLSMGMSGTDMFHHLEFLKQAEAYRRVFIQTLNDEYAFGGSKTGERGWKADTEFFKSVKDFAYLHPNLSMVFSNYTLDALSLLFWFAASILLLISVSKRASVS